MKFQISKCIEEEISAQNIRNTKVNRKERRERREGVTTKTQRRKGPAERTVRWPRTGKADEWRQTNGGRGIWLPTRPGAEKAKPGALKKRFQHKTHEIRNTNVNRKERRDAERV